jgi:Family of unknown function (DUF6132)
MKNKYLKLTVFAVIGAIGGFAYYYYIGCYNGQCLISSNPYISSGYGMAAGLLLAWDSKKKPKADEKQ